MKTVKLGIVGCGAICGTHAEAVNRAERVELVGFFDLDESRAEQAADAYGGRSFPDLSGLLEASDAVCVCVPSGHHAEVSIAAARAGVHVLCEKPIETTAAKALAMVEAFEGRGLKLGVISQHRMADDIQFLRGHVQSGALGVPIACDISVKWYRTQAYYDSAGWRGTWELDGGGCLMNQGVHYIDMGQWVMGGVKAVRAVTKTAAHERIEVEDVANALLEYENGAVGVLQGSTSYFPGFSERIEVHGSYGSVIVEGDVLKLWEVDPVASGTGLYGRGVMSQPTPSIELVGHALEPLPESKGSVPWGEHHQRQIQDFADAIIEDRAPFISGRDALQPLAVILAVYRSAAQGGERVEVKDVLG